MANLKAPATPKSSVDVNGRPEYPAVPDLQPRLDEKKAALDARLKLVEDQASAERARFKPA